MILPNDILIRKTTNGTTVWVSQRMVLAMCGIKEFVLRTTARKRYKQLLPACWQKSIDNDDFLLGDNGKSWRWGRRNGQYYYDIDRIPNRKPCCYRDMLPTKEELIEYVDENKLRASRERQTKQRAMLLNLSAEFTTEEDVRWLNASSGISLNIATCRDYGKALGWCRFIASTLRTGFFMNYGYVTKDAFYEACAQVISAQKLANLKTSTAASLRKKMIGFPDDVSAQRRWIISGKIGNDNRKIVGKYQIVDVTTGEILDFDIHQAIMYNAYMNIDDPRKEYKETLYNEVYVPAMEAFGEMPIALRTFNAKLAMFSNRLKTDLHRHGIDYYKKKLLTYIPSAKLSFSHSLFCGDGSGLVGYKFWKRVKDKDGKIRHKITIMNIYAMLISDVASGYISGYDFSPEGIHSENDNMVRNAVKMSVRNGGYRTMFEFVSDNFSAFSTAHQKEYLRSVFNVVRSIEPGNSQANPAEMQFRLFKNSTLRRMKNFIRSSHGATSIENRANVDSLKKEDYPTYPEAIQQIVEAIDCWNNTPRGNGLTPAQMFAENKHPECKPMDEVQLRQIFGHQTKVEVTRMRGFVNLEHNKENFLFEIPDWPNSGAQKISAATGNGYDAVVYVNWDENGADLYSSDGRFIMTCPPSGRANQSHIERTADQLAAQRRMAERKQSQIDDAIEFSSQAQDALQVLYSGNGYEADVCNGGGKESTNEAYEAEVNAMIPETAKGKKSKEVIHNINPKTAALNRFIFGTN